MQLKGFEVGLLPVLSSCEAYEYGRPEFNED